MKLLRSLLAVLVVASFVAAAPAQVIVQRGRQRSAAVPANPQALSALQQDLITAVEAMKSALPIYDGDRVRSIHAAHAALLIVDRAIAGVNAVHRTVPTVKDQVTSSSAKTQYTSQQIAASQASMQKGLAALQQAWKDLQTAAGSNPNQKAINVSNHLKVANAEATKALALHPTRP